MQSQKSREQVGWHECWICRKMVNGVRCGTRHWTNYMVFQDTRDAAQKKHYDSEAPRDPAILAKVTTKKVPTKTASTTTGSTTTNHHHHHHEEEEEVAPTPNRNTAFQKTQV